MRVQQRRGGTTIRHPFLLPSGRGLRQLYFGGEGSGKTEIATGIARLCPGRYLYVDNEGSADEYPMHRYSKDEPWGLLALNAENEILLPRVLAEELGRQPKGQGLYDAIGLDGLTEAADTADRRIRNEYTAKYKKEGAKERTLSRYDDLRVETADLLARLVALSDYGVGIICTAMAERGSDPDFPAGLEAIPAVLGSIRHRLGKFFTQSIYVEVVSEKVGQVVKPVHLYHFLKDGPYRVKNRYEAEWTDDPKTFPPTLKNPTTEQIVALVQEAARRKASRAEVNE